MVKSGIYISALMAIFSLTQNGHKNQGLLDILFISGIVHKLRLQDKVVECATWLPETREPEKKTRESRHRAGHI